MVLFEYPFTFHDMVGFIHRHTGTRKRCSRFPFVNHFNSSSSLRICLANGEPIHMCKYCTSTRLEHKLLPFRVLLQCDNLRVRQTRTEHCQMIKALWCMCNAPPHTNCVSDPDEPSPRGFSSFVPVSPDIMLELPQRICRL